MRRLLAGGLFLAVFAAGMRSLCPSVFADDSPETVTALFLSGISHAPGDPLLPKTVDPDP